VPGSWGDRRLTLADIEDIRAYERGREAFREQIIELKRKRRVPVGPLVTLLFENRQTIRFQVQEMARIERMTTDAQIQGELDVYNPLIPAPGELSATMFVELTSEEALRQWLSKLVGIERSVELRIGEEQGRPLAVVSSVPDATHAHALTREDVTSSVHYVRLPVGHSLLERFAAGPVTLAVAHPEYSEETLLSDETRDELVGDLRG
jgi:hypothetical protein